MSHHFPDFPLPAPCLRTGDDTMPGDIETIQRDSPLTRSRFAVRECSEFNTHSASSHREPGINAPVIDTNNTDVDTHDTKLTDAAPRNPAATGVSGGPTYSDPATANGGHGYWKHVHAHFSLCLSDARRPIGLYWKNASPYEIKRRDEAISQAIGWGSR